MPHAGERVWEKAGRHIAPCLSVGYGDALLLGPESPVDARAGDLRNGQEFFFEERVVEGKPLAVSCSSPAVVRHRRYPVEEAGRCLAGGQDGRPAAVEVVLLSGLFRAAGLVVACFEGVTGWSWVGLHFCGAETGAAD